MKIHNFRIMMFLLIGVLFLNIPSVYAQSANDYINQGNQDWINNKDYDGAITAFTQAIALDPQATGAYIGRGFAKNGKADYNGALADFNQAIALDPNNALAYSGRSDAKNALGDSAGAAADKSQAEALNPDLKDNSGAAW